MEKIINSLSVIILNWNAIDDTIRCLSKIKRWTSLKPNIYVVDNGSYKSIQYITDKFPYITIIVNDYNKGFSGGNNTAVNIILSEKYKKNILSDSKYILLLNNDAFINEEDISILLDYHNHHDDVAVSGPVIYSCDVNNKRIINAGGLDPSRYIKTYWDGCEVEKYLIHQAEPYLADYVSGTVAVIRRDVFQKVGLFDERYFFSCEMADLCERIKNSGYLCVIHPKARAYHDMHSVGKRRNTLYLYYSLRNRFLFIRKFRRKQMLLLFCYWTFISGKGIVSNLLTGNFATVRAIILALRDGVTGNYGGKNHLFLAD